MLSGLTCGRCSTMGTNVKYSTLEDKILEQIIPAGSILENPALEKDLGVIISTDLEPVLKCQELQIKRPTQC